MPVRSLCPGLAGDICMLRPSSSNLNLLDDIIGPILGSWRIPGAAVAIMAGGEVVFAKGFGYRNFVQLGASCGR
jgi:CubicO group peptidase (beta-lactamase class C family)